MGRSSGLCAGLHVELPRPEHPGGRGPARSRRISFEQYRIWMGALGVFAGLCAGVACNRVASRQARRGNRDGVGGGAVVRHVRAGRPEPGHWTTAGRAHVARGVRIGGCSGGGQAKRQLSGAEEPRDWRSDDSGGSQYRGTGRTLAGGGFARMAAAAVRLRRAGAAVGAVVSADPAACASL